MWITVEKGWKALNSLYQKQKVGKLSLFFKYYCGKKFKRKEKIDEIPSY
jgi:hypothetical protein